MTVHAVVVVGDEWVDARSSTPSQPAIDLAVVIPRYTPQVKTAISVPDDVYERAERAARKRGMNRSQFYATAAARYVADLEASDVTEAIDAAIDVSEGDTSAAFAAEAGRVLLSSDAEAW